MRSSWQECYSFSCCPRSLHWKRFDTLCIDASMLPTRTLRARLRFLYGNYRLVLLWPLLATVLAAVAWVLLLRDLEYEETGRSLVAAKQAELLAKGYADQLARTVEGIDRLILHVRYDWSLTHGRLSLENAARAGLIPTASWFFAGILDRNGKLVASSLPSTSGDYIGDESYFLAQQRSAQDALYIGKPEHVGTWQGEEVLFFSRRLEDANGQFDGVVFASVSPSYVVAQGGEQLYGPSSFLAVIGSDGALCAEQSARESDMAENAGLAAVPELLPKQGGHALLNGARWFTDRRNRFVGWHRVDQYGLTAMVGLDAATVLEPFLKRRSQLLRVAGWATFVLGLFALVATSLSLRLAWRKYQMERTHRSYRMATEGGTEGFYIVRPVYSEAGSLVDFTMVDCNQIGARMFQRRREEMNGVTVSALYAHADPRTLQHILQQSLSAGEFEGEVEVPADSPLDMRWAHVKVVRSGDNLAITLRDISATKAHVAELERRTNEDVLTGLPNRHWLQGYLPDALQRARTSRSLLALLFIDLDGFKGVNDAWGHAAGDEVLRTAARRLQEAIRPHDCVVRLAGDEFVVVLDNMRQKMDAAHVAERILRAFDDDFRLEKGARMLGVSIGISVFPDDGESSDMLLQNADIAMYSVKTSGKHGYRFFNQRFYDALRMRLQWEYELRKAVERDEFVVYYQPRADAKTGKICSMEALVRWQHPRRGIVSPAEFIPLAEETGLILRLGELVAEKVCGQLGAWREHSQSVDIVPVSINVSSRQFNETDVAQTLKSALDRYGIPPELLEVELTESSMMGDAMQVARSLNVIQAMGVKLLVDDFGTGYSSLSQLQLLDFDVLKVDKSFTGRLEAGESGVVFYRAIITMAHELGMRVVAEGVETARQASILKDLDCDELQGFYISKPLSAQNIGATAL
ncbi:GGDEF and EAL domain-containing protein [Oxalobacteraceae bacterium OM1]|nr:GGDEF and EAL domain-containing protein [Oxalobacteraceae bacterium OM1]